MSMLPSPAPAFRFIGALSALDPATRTALLDRTTSVDREVQGATASILADVRVRGDAALRELARRFDGVALGAIEVPRAECAAAVHAMDGALRRAMERAVRNIESVHRAFRPSAVEVSPEPGVVIGRRPDPLARVGVYAPGGRAAYPSSVLMGAVPARVAGVREVFVASPPARNGLPASTVLAAAELAGVDRVFAIGGAGAIGAMAFGTESVPRVDRIVGPGNAYVAEAKLQVSGSVSIDAPAGPSELLVVADASAPADVVAREMIAQAEHDPRACVVAVVEGERLGGRVQAAVRAAMRTAVRREIVETALARQGAVLWVDSLDEAVAWSEAYAPEHLLVCASDAGGLLPRLRNAGTIFVGEHASVAFGDYMTGANHVLPTGGLARCYSGLSTSDFVRWTTYQRITREAAVAMAVDVDLFARSEGLPGHAAAARAWTESV
jgi:histidinol dehydrogenase